jgi:hypothetical protein
MKFKFKDKVKVTHNPFYEGTIGFVIAYKKGDYSYGNDSYTTSYTVDFEGVKVLLDEEQLEIANESV